MAVFLAFGVARSARQARAGFEVEQRVAGVLHAVAGQADALVAERQVARIAILQERRVAGECHRHQLATGYVRRHVGRQERRGSFGVRGLGEPELARTDQVASRDPRPQRMRDRRRSQQQSSRDRRLRDVDRERSHQRDRGAQREPIIMHDRDG